METVFPKKNALCDLGIVTIKRESWICLSETQEKSTNYNSSSKKASTSKTTGTKVTCQESLKPKFDSSKSSQTRKFKEMEEDQLEKDADDKGGCWSLNIFYTTPPPTQQKNFVTA